MGLGQLGKDRTATANRPVNGQLEAADAKGISLIGRLTCLGVGTKIRAVDTLIGMAAAHPWAFWVGGGVILAILEMAVPSFTFIFGAVAALPTALIALRFGIAAQLCAFSGFLVLLLLLVRPRLLSKVHNSAKIPSRSGALIGKRASVTEAIDPLKGTGRVSVDGEDWSARAPKALAVGQTVNVVGSDGIILKVEES